MSMALLFVFTYHLHFGRKLLATLTGRQGTKQQLSSFYCNVMTTTKNEQVRTGDSKVSYE